MCGAHARAPSAAPLPPRDRPAAPGPEETGEPGPCCSPHQLPPPLPCLTRTWAGARPSLFPPAPRGPHSRQINEFRRACSFIWVITARASGATPRLQGRVRLISSLAAHYHPGSFHKTRAQPRPGARRCWEPGRRSCRRGRRGAGLAARGSKVGELGLGLKLEGKPESPRRGVGNGERGETRKTPWGLRKPALRVHLAVISTTLLKFSLKPSRPAGRLHIWGIVPCAPRFRPARRRRPPYTLSQHRPLPRAAAAPERGGHPASAEGRCLIPRPDPPEAQEPFAPPATRGQRAGREGGVVTTPAPAPRRSQPGLARGLGGREGGTRPRPQRLQPAA